MTRLSAYGGIPASRAYVGRLKRISALTLTTYTRLQYCYSAILVVVVPISIFVRVADLGYSLVQHIEGAAGCIYVFRQRCLVTNILYHIVFLHFMVARWLRSHLKTRCAKSVFYV